MADLDRIWFADWCRKWDISFAPPHSALDAYHDLAARYAAGAGDLPKILGPEDDLPVGYDPSLGRHWTGFSAYQDAPQWYRDWCERYGADGMIGSAFIGLCDHHAGHDDPDAEDFMQALDDLDAAQRDLEDAEDDAVVADSVYDDATLALERTQRLLATLDITIVTAIDRSDPGQTWDTVTAAILALEDVVYGEDDEEDED